MNYQSRQPKIGIMTKVEFDTFADDVSPYKLPETIVAKISPELAAAILDERSNALNKFVRPANVPLYAQMMRDGRWHYSVSEIQIGSDGKILNGHNRLRAIAESGINVAITLKNNCEPKTFVYHDTGRIRNNSDRFGVPKWAMLPANDLILKCKGSAYQRDDIYLDAWLDSVDAITWSKLTRLHKQGAHTLVTNGAARTAILYALSANLCDVEFANDLILMLSKNQHGSFSPLTSNFYTQSQDKRFVPLNEKGKTSARSREHYAKMTFLFTKENHMNGRVKWHTGKTRDEYVAEVNDGIRVWGENILDGHRNANDHGLVPIRNFF